MPAPSAKYLSFIKIIGLTLFVLLATAKISAILYSLTTDPKKEFVQEDQESEKEETTKKPVEASAEKKFTIFNSRYSHQVLIATQTFHNTIYLNNYQSSFYGWITTPPPDFVFNA